MVRLLGQPRRYKHHANAPQCYVIRTVPMLVANTGAFTRRTSRRCLKSFQGHLYFYQPICLPTIYPLTYLPTYLSIYPSICLSVCLSVRPSIYPSIYLSVCLCLSVYVLSVHICIYIYIYKMFHSTVCSLTVTSHHFLSSFSSSHFSSQSLLSLQPANRTQPNLTKHHTFST